MPLISSSISNSLRTITSSFSPHFSHLTIPSTKTFHTSSAIMTVKCYFDVAWKGPVLDAQHKQTSKTEGNESPRSSMCLPLGPRETSFSWGMFPSPSSIHPNGERNETIADVATRTKGTHQLQSLRGGCPQNRRKLPCPVHPRERLWVPRFNISPSDSRFHAPGR